MKFIRFLLFPIALVYGLITVLRNGFYAVGIFKASKFSIPVINVGNLSMGGTGKTPHTEYLVRLLMDKTNLFTLSRGFGRKERGFIMADENASANRIGDEPMQYYLKFGHKIGVAVDANRVTGVMDICRIKPETNLILLDDAYQHRAIYTGLNILITDYSNPFYTDFMLPVGNLRELRQGKKRADIIVVSKCPNFDTIDKKHILKRIAPKKHQHVFFSKVIYGQVFKLDNPQEQLTVNNLNLIVVTGIAQPQPFINHLEQNNTLLHHFNFNDHYNFKEADIRAIHNLFDKFVGQNPVIITTEKDAMRLLGITLKPKLNGYPWFYQSIEIEIDNAEALNRIVNQYVEKNS